VEQKAALVEIIYNELYILTVLRMRRTKDHIAVGKRPTKAKLT
jgi:hypothetical protein